MSREWQIKELGPENLSKVPELPPVIARLLALRGIVSSESAADFLNPDYSKLHDPFIFQDMQKAVTRIREAIEKNEKVAIYADYDADAITACAVVYLALQKLGTTADFYIPDRFTEGYGMNVEAVKQLAENGVKLIITVDCGTNSVAEAAACLELGMDLIITDHHEITEELPRAFALINPKNPQDQYPFPFLTGVGVAFKLTQALLSRNTDHVTHDKAEGWEKWLLDLVAIGTVADLQSLSGENRILVNFGLKVIAKTRWPGLKAMIEQAQITRKIDAYTLGFTIAPRINAAGRIKHGSLAFELLTCENDSRAGELALEISELNQRRQLLTDTVLSEARGQIEQMLDKKVLLVAGHDWPKGVVGLVAGKLTEEFNRPVLVISISPDGSATGSGRSVNGYDLVEALKQAKEHLSKFGGHTLAAGFSLDEKNLSELHLKLLEHAENVNFALAEPTIKVDAELQPEEITWDIYGHLEKFEPYGFGNPRPKFIGRKFEILDLRTVGSANQHLKLTLKFGEHRLPAVAFGRGSMVQQLRAGQSIDTVFELTANEWNGNKNLELKLIDIKANE